MKYVATIDIEYEAEEDPLEVLHDILKTAAWLEPHSRSRLLVLSFRTATRPRKLKEGS